MAGPGRQPVDVPTTCVAKPPHEAAHWTPPADVLCESIRVNLGAPGSRACLRCSPAH